MAINNTVSYGGLFNAPKNNYGGLLSPTGISPTGTSGLFSSAPSASQTSFNPSSQSITGLVNPIAHPALGSSPSVGAVKSMTVKPDGTVQTTHDTGTSIAPVNGATGVNPNAGQYGTGAAGSTSAPTTSTTSPTAGFPGAVSTLQGLTTPSTATQQGLQQSGQAFQGTQDYIKQLEQSKVNEATALQEQAGQPIPLGDITGRQQALANYYAQQQAALGSAGQAESALYSPGLSAAVTGTGQQVSAAGTAAGVTQPQLAGFNQQAFNPETGTFSGGASMSDAVSNAINLIKSGSGYNNAVSTLSAYGQPGVNALLQALGPGFNINSSNAEAATQAQNISTVGTAATSAANTAYNAAVQKVAANTATYSALTGVSNNLNETLGNWTQNGILTSVNQGINTIAGLTSNPDYQKFVAALGNAQASYQAALGASGVTPTKADQDAVAALNPSSSATAINAALNQLSADAHALLIVPAYQQQQSYGSQLGIQ